MLLRMAYTRTFPAKYAFQGNRKGLRKQESVSWCGFWIVSYHIVSHTTQKLFQHFLFLAHLFNSTFHSFSPRWPLLRYTFVCFLPGEKKTKEIRQRNSNKNINIREKESTDLYSSCFLRFFFLLHFGSFLALTFLLASGTIRKHTHKHTHAFWSLLIFNSLCLWNIYNPRAQNICWSSHVPHIKSISKTNAIFCLLRQIFSSFRFDAVIWCCLNHT